MAEREQQENSKNSKRTATEPQDERKRTAIEKQEYSKKIKKTKGCNIENKKK